MSAPGPLAGKVEHEVHEHQFLISRTDVHTRITYVNDTFAQVCGYSESELIGATNALFRHPDMPDAVFDDILATLKKNRIWSGIMKHRRKDGSFFWAAATISPIVVGNKTVGYTTVRTRPDPAHVAQASAAYAALKRGRQRTVAISGGRIVRRGPLGWLGRSMQPTVNARLTRMRWLAIAGLASSAALPCFGISAGYAAALLFLGLLVACCKLQIVILDPLQAASDLCKKLSAGDLGEKIEAQREDEVGWHIAGLGTMQKSLASVVRNVKSGVVAVETAAREINAGNLELSGKNEQQAAAIEQTAATMGQLTNNVKKNAEHAEQASQLAATTSDMAARGGRDVQHVVARINDMSCTARKMESFIDVIDGVAFQTNVLALNAAVEAARAGGHGRGFAVVAAEVRNLAQRSAAASKEIRQLINSAVDEIDKTRRVGEATAGTMDDIVRAVRRVSELMGDIAGATVEQSSGIEQIDRAIAHIDEATQHNAAFVEQLAATAASLETQAKSLKNSVEVFRLSA